MSSIVNKSEKPWSVDQFEMFRPHMTEFVRHEVVPLLNQQESNNRNRLLIHGQVKVGKREIVEYITVRDSFNQYRIHVFVSSFHRKADKSQRDELEMHGINVFSIHNKRRRDASIKFIADQLSSNINIRVVIHWDECDYGTGDRQNLSDMYRMFRDNDRVFNILYSATPEEMLYSNEIAANRNPDNSFISDFYEDGAVIKYTPPPGYCGAQKFLDHNLVEQALPFFEQSENKIKLSDQAKSILLQAKTELRVTNRKRRRLQDELEDAEDAGNISRVEALKSELRRIPVRNIIALRLSYCLNDDDDEEYDEECCDNSSIASLDSKDSNGVRSSKAIYSFLKCSQFVPELSDVTIIADKPDVIELMTIPNVKTEVVQWSKPAYWDTITKDQIVIIVNDQTSTRSTEWVCHNRMFAAHDYRKRLTFNTVAQAQLRPAHYEQNYGGFQPIRIYGDLKTFQFAVGQINAAEYLHSEWIIRKVPKSDPPRYRIKNVIDGKKHMPVVNIDVGGTSLTFSGIPEPSGFNSEVAQKILVQLGGTNNGCSKMSQRVRGNSKRIPKIMARFYECEPEQKHMVLDHIQSDPELAALIGGHAFNARSYFNNQEMDSGRYMGYLRGRKVLCYNELKDELWGIRVGFEEVRLTECYHEGRLGLCLRVATGLTTEVNDLEAYKSMYQGKK